VLIVVSFYLQKQVVRSIRESSRLCTTTKSPIISHLTETISGSSTIRAFGYSKSFIDSQLLLVDKLIIATQFNIGIQCFFGIRVSICATIFVALICAICVITRETTSPVLLSLLLTYSMSIQDNLQWLLMLQMAIEKLMVSA
jgi:ABC-type multidrug transport system fused ATPase/permease subunit